MRRFEGLPQRRISRGLFVYVIMPVEVLDMNQRDLSEIKRRLNPDRRNPTLLCGCYISGDGRVIASFAQLVGAMPQEENEKYMAIFRRCL